MNVQISPNLRKETARINPSGDIIDKQGRVLERNVPDYIPTKAEIEASINGTPMPSATPVASTPAPVSTNLTIQEQIEATEKHLESLKEQKKTQIEQMKAELAKLENS